MHRVERVWLIMVSPLMVSHVDGDGCMKRWKEVVGTCESDETREMVTYEQLNVLKQIKLVH